MKKRNENKKIREKCGNCFYNGNCNISLNKCFFIKQERKTKAI